jgi:hypothetical protein
MMPVAQERHRTPLRLAMGRSGTARSSWTRDLHGHCDHAQPPAVLSLRNRCIACLPRVLYAQRPAGTLPCGTWNNPEKHTNTYACRLRASWRLTGTDQPAGDPMKRSGATSLPTAIPPLNGSHMDAHVTGCCFQAEETWYYRTAREGATTGTTQPTAIWPPSSRIGEPQKGRWATPEPRGRGSGRVVETPVVLPWTARRHPFSVWRDAEGQGPTRSG